MTKNAWGEEEQSPEAKEGAEPVTAQEPSDKRKESREWRLIEKMVGSLHVEHRRTRRWGYERALY